MEAQTVKLYFIPYTLKTYLSDTKFHSGIDVSMMSTMKITRDMGHETRVFCLAGNLDTTQNSAFIYKQDLPESELKSYFKTNKKKIYEKLYSDILDYKPDLIFSCHDVNPVYTTLLSILDVPIIYHNHTMPGFFSDLNNANLFSSLSKRSVYTMCVSEYHKKKFIKYYRSKRSLWDFDELIPDNILPSIYTDTEFQAQESDGVIRHVSAMNPGKKTFGIHEFMSDTEYPTEVYTTSSYLSSDIKIKEYGETNLNKFATDPLRTTLLDQPHDTIMESISKSLCTFVGLAPYDTFTITSFESLCRGVPLILFGTKERDHPALEMCDSVMFDKYIRIVRNRDEFRSAVSYFSTLAKTDRQDLASRSYAKNSDHTYKNKLGQIYAECISKHSTAVDQLENNLEQFFTLQ